MKTRRVELFLSCLILTGLISGLLSGLAFARQGADSILSLKRIFFKPYICGTRPSDPNVSPDGKLILFRWDSTARNKYRNWLIGSDGSNLHQIADTLLGELSWSPDSRSVACTRKGDLFLTDTSFHTFERLTKTDASENSLSFSPDGKYLVFSSDDKLMALPVGAHGVYDLAKPSSKDASVNLVDFTPDSKKIIFTESDREGLKEFVVPRYTGKEVTTRSFKSGVGKFRIGIAPIDTGAIVWVKLPGDKPASGAAEERFFQGDVALSPDGRSILVERFSSNRKKREIFVAGTDSGKATLVYTETDKTWMEGGLATTRWIPGGKQILTTSEKEGWNHLYAMDPDGKHPIKLTDGEWEIHWFDVDPDKSAKKVYFLANKDDHHQWQLFALDMDSKEITRISRESGTYDSPVMAKDGSFIVAKHSNFGMPDELVRVSTRPPHHVTAAAATSDEVAEKLEAETRLTHSIPEEFRKANWTIPEIVNFKSKDGTTVPAMIYKPRDFNPAKKYPVVVFVHGAGYLQNVYRGWSYYYREYLFHHRLTQRGYVVLEVDYRGSAGYGRNFRADVYMHLGGKDLQDELDGLEYLKSLGYIDPGRVGIYGGSYGGFMTLMGLFLSDKYACGAALRAVTSWENYYRHNSWYTEARLGKPEVDSEAYKISSPLTFADSLKKPLLILHGMVDDNVFFQDAVQLMNKLQKSGKKFETMMYPEEAHSFTEPESWYDEYSRIEEFFDRYLKPEGKL
jgi:dipeptidyl aminopeptidase/acylaminoacyl peptidase